MPSLKSLCASQSHFLWFPFLCKLVSLVLVFIFISSYSHFHTKNLFFSFPSFLPSSYMLKSFLILFLMPPPVTFQYCKLREKCCCVWWACLFLFFFNSHFIIISIINIRTHIFVLLSLDCHIQSSLCCICDQTDTSFYSTSAFFIFETILETRADSIRAYFWTLFFCVSQLVSR